MKEPRRTAEDPRSPEALLAHTGWMRSLALGLVRDPAGAEDLVQDTLLAALERPAAEEWATSTRRSPLVPPVCFGTPHPASHPACPGKNTRREL